MHVLFVRCQISFTYTSIWFFIYFETQLFKNSYLIQNYFWFFSSDSFCYLKYREIALQIDNCFSRPSQNQTLWSVYAYSLVIHLYLKNAFSIWHFIFPRRLNQSGIHFISPFYHFFLFISTYFIFHLFSRVINQKVNVYYYHHILLDWFCANAWLFHYLNLNFNF